MEDWFLKIINEEFERHLGGFFKWKCYIVWLYNELCSPVKHVRKARFTDWPNWNCLKYKLQCTAHADTGSNFVLLDPSSVFELICEQQLSFWLKYSFISIIVPAEASGCNQFSLNAFLVSPEFISKVDLNKCIPVAGLYSVLSAVETQQHQLYKLQPLQVLLCWHLLPGQKQESTDLVNHSPLIICSESKDESMAWKEHNVQFCQRGPPRDFVSTYNDERKRLFVFVIMASWRSVTQIALLPWVDSSSEVSLPHRLPTS